MATVEDALFARTQAVGGITSLVGVRVYPLKLPQTPTLPAVTYQRISTTRQSAMGNDPAIAWARFQVTSYATTYLAVKALARAVQAGLQRYSGTSATVVVIDTFLEGEQDDFGEAENDAGIYAVMQDYTMVHRE